MAKHNKSGPIRTLDIYYVRPLKSDSKLKYVSAFVLLPKLYYSLTTYSIFFLDSLLQLESDFIPNFDPQQ